MNGRKSIKGFSRLSRDEKIELAAGFSGDPESFRETLAAFRHTDPGFQKLFEGFSENTVSNYFLPFGIAPNFLVNDREYIVPMVIEESSVVAAASKSAGFWFTRGGFKAEVESTVKPGHVYFKSPAAYSALREIQDELEAYLIGKTMEITRNMRSRGGGIRSVRILDIPEMPGHYKLEGVFETADSMGANFINTCLEAFAGLMPGFLAEHGTIHTEKETEITMAILSNHIPECIVSVQVDCPIEDLPDPGPGISRNAMAEKFRDAVEIARHDPYRAVTHNKGIFNGVDAVVMATGNDYRAVEAGGHAFAVRSGRYSGLTRADISGGIFRYRLRLPLALGTVGGLTNNHPLAKLSLDLLGNPDSRQLMQIAASAGMANNFSALWSLVTSGIQQGHMKLHLSNILTSLGATRDERILAAGHFEEQTVSYGKVREFLRKQRKA